MVRLDLEKISVYVSKQCPDFPDDIQALSIHSIEALLCVGQLFRPKTQGLPLFRVGFVLLLQESCFDCVELSVGVDHVHFSRFGMDRMGGAYNAALRFSNDSL